MYAKVFNIGLDFVVKPLISKYETRAKHPSDQLVFPRMCFDYPHSMSRGINLNFVNTDTTQCQHPNRRSPYCIMTGRAAEITFH